MEERVFLLPGEYHVSRRPGEIATLLGSCVAVCLWNPLMKFSAMNHFLLPDGTPSNEDKGRYGQTATETIIWLMQKLDPNLKNLQAKIFGGGMVVGHLGSATSIGSRNIEVARSVLASYKIPIVAEDVAGTQGRRIYMDTSTGSVRVRKIEKTEETNELARKRAAIASRDTRVLIVDDSPLVRKILRKAVESSNGLEVCGEAEDAFEARDMILSLDPDVISLDIIMPKLDGLKFLKKLSQYFPKPVVICSTIAKDNSDIYKRAIEYGAVDVVDKDALALYQGMDVVMREYIPKIRKASGKVVRKKIFDK